MIRLVPESTLKRLLDKRGLTLIEGGDDGVIMWEVGGEKYLILIEPINSAGYCPYQVDKLLRHIDSGVAMPIQLSTNDSEDEGDGLGDCVGSKDYNVIKMPIKS
jgi:hypothetical protein